MPIKFDFGTNQGAGLTLAQPTQPNLRSQGLAQALSALTAIFAKRNAEKAKAEKVEKALKQFNQFMDKAQPKEITYTLFDHGPWRGNTEAKSRDEKRNLIISSLVNEDSPWSVQQARNIADSQLEERIAYIWDPVVVMSARELLIGSGIPDSAAHDLIETRTGNGFSGWKDFVDDVERASYKSFSEAPRGYKPSTVVNTGKPENEIPPMEPTSFKMGTQTWSSLGLNVDNLSPLTDPATRRDVTFTAKPNLKSWRLFDIEVTPPESANSDAARKAAADIQKQINENPMSYWAQLGRASRPGELLSNAEALKEGYRTWKAAKEQYPFAPDPPKMAFQGLNEEINKKFQQGIEMPSGEQGWNLQGLQDSLRVKKPSEDQSAPEDEGAPSTWDQFQEWKKKQEGGGG